MIKIVITGGICSGKSTALVKCAEELKQRGIHCFIVPDASQMLMNAGAQEFPMNQVETVLYHKHIMQMQMALEDVFIEVGGDFHPDERVVVLCENGVMSSSAYLSENDWQALLDDSGWSTTQLRDRRYDLVIHLVTAADGAEEYYRPGTYCKVDEDEAYTQDRKLQKAWIGHPYFKIIDNNVETFTDKLYQCFETLCQFLNTPGANKFYKKYLISSGKT